MKTIILGASYKDIITGFSGVATGNCIYLSGCDQVLLVPKSKKDDHKESHWFDIQRVKRIGKTQIKLDNSKTPGFDKPAPRK